MAIQTEKLQKLVDQLEKYAAAKEISPDDLAEALDILTQATVEGAVLQGEINQCISNVGDKISLVEVVVPDPEGAEIPEEEPGPERPRVPVIPDRRQADGADGATVEPAPKANQPEGLRWTKVDNGEPVRYFVDGLTNKPEGVDDAALHNATLRAIATWQQGTSLRFVWDSTNPDIPIRWNNIDGRGGILGQAYQPTTGIEMSGCVVCGQAEIDSGEQWNSERLTKTVVHEIGHSLGLDHTDNPRDIMFPRVVNTSTRRSANDTKQILAKYPKRNAR